MLRAYVLGLTRNHLKGVTVVARVISASLRTFVVGVARRLKRLPLNVGKGGFAAGRSKLRSVGARGSQKCNWLAEWRAGMTQPDYVLA